MARCTFSARAAVIRAAVAVLLALALGMTVGLAGSVADASETPAGPLGVSPYDLETASDAFVGGKLGVGNAGERMQSAAAPRDLADAGSDWSWYEPEPVYEEPVYEEPVYEAPVYEEPAYEAPVYEEPAYEEPAYEEPVYEEPAYEEPVYEEPAYEEPPVVWYDAVASAYDPNCNGGTGTASGIPLDWWTPTVASPWLPLGSYIEIYYGGMTVVAQVTDRGPYIGGRDLDLAPGVFYAFGFDSANSWGVRSVSYRVL